MWTVPANGSLYCPRRTLKALWKGDAHQSSSGMSLFPIRRSVAPEKKPDQLSLAFRRLFSPPYKEGAEPEQGSQPHWWLWLVPPLIYLFGAGCFLRDNDGRGCCPLLHPTNSPSHCEVRLRWPLRELSWSQIGWLSKD
jgi:hypothetical protein